MRIVLFLGAGFSASFDLPVMNSFFPLARQSAALSADEKEFLEAIQRFAHRGVRLISIPRNNLEAILSFLVMAEQLGIRPKEMEEILAKCKASNAEILLRQIVRKIYGPIKWEMLRQHAGPFGNLVHYSGRHLQDDLTIVTTNYDLVAETMMLVIRERASLPGNWLSTSGRTPADDNSSSLYDMNGRTKICKLHGSVNWKDATTEETKDKFRVEQRCESYSKVGNRNDSMFLPKAVMPDFHREVDYAPIVVGPTLFKHQADPKFAPIWQTAAAALAAAEHVLFVGYSFPESDTYMRYFLGASLVENVNLESIRILDPRAIQICKDLTDDKHYGEHFKDLLRPLEHKWAETNPWK
jgi:hypothetical protein